MLVVETLPHASIIDMVKSSLRGGNCSYIYRFDRHHKLYTVSTVIT
jgi:hypothetical protein